MYKPNPETAKQFEEEYWTPLERFLSGLQSNVREPVIKLMELEYQRGYEEGRINSEYENEQKLNVSYNNGWDDAMEKVYKALDKIN